MKVPNPHFYYLPLCLSDSKTLEMSLSERNSFELR